MSRRYLNEVSLARAVYLDAEFMVCTFVSQADSREAKLVDLSRHHSSEPVALVINPRESLKEARERANRRFNFRIVTESSLPLRDRMQRGIIDGNRCSDKAEVIGGADVASRGRPSIVSMVPYSRLALQRQLTKRIVGAPPVAQPKKLGSCDNRVRRITIQ